MLQNLITHDLFLILRVNCLISFLASQTRYYISYDPCIMYETTPLLKSHLFFSFSALHSSIIQMLTLEESVEGIM